MEDTTTNLDPAGEERLDREPSDFPTEEIKGNQTGTITKEEIAKKVQESNEKYREEIVPAKPIKSKRGGKRPNSGRPRKEIYLQKHTIASRKSSLAMQMRIVRQTPRLLNSMIVLARGVSYLMKVETGKKAVIVKDPKEMLAFLDGIVEDSATVKYYFLTTEKPDIHAIQDLLDRAYGKPRQTVGLDGGAEGKPISVESYERAKRAILGNLPS